MQRRLFRLFLLLAFLPAALVLAVNWQMSQRHLAYLDSPGLRGAMESSLALARETLEREKGEARREADKLAALIAEVGAASGAASGAEVGAESGASSGAEHETAAGIEGLLPAPLPGASYRFADPEAPERRLGRGSPDPLEHFSERLDAAARDPLRVEWEGRPHLLAVAPASWRGRATRLVLLTPLDAELAASLDAIAQGGSHFRQLRLFYGDLLRGSTLITLVVLGLALLLLSLWLSRRFAREIAGPLRELARGTEQVAAGDLDHQVEAKALDEVGDLVAAFNRMTAQLRKSREDLVRAERVAAWQGVARRLAHEIKNPLTPITLAMHRIERRSDDATVRECVDAVLEETQNLQRLADEFSQFARLPSPVKERIELRGLIAAVAELYLGQRRVALSWEGWPEALFIEADPGQLRQVFANLIKNALEAMSDGGRLTLGLEASGEEDLAVWVRDEGPGLPDAPEIVFAPSFSTKSTGAGLGLAIASKIVEDHGGRLTARNLPAGGAEFRVELPVAGPAEPRRDS